MTRISLTFLVLLQTLHGQENNLPPMKKPMEQATVHARQATEAMRRGEWKLAKTQWELLLKLQPESAAALANLGSVEIQLNQPAEAQQHLDAAVRLSPGLANAWVSLWSLHETANRPMLALSCISRAVHEEQANPRHRNALAITLKKLGWVKGAELELQKAIDLDPSNGDAHVNLALLYMDLKPPQEESARRHYLRAKSLGADPDPVLEKQFTTPAAEEEKEVKK